MPYGRRLIYAARRIAIARGIAYLCTMEAKKPQRIDVEEVVRSKSQRLAGIKPIVRCLRRTIHEDEINRILDKYENLPTIEFIRAALREMGITYELVGIEKLDPKGCYIFASNHPFGGLDGLMLAEKVAGYFGDVKVVVNDLLMNIEPLKSIFIPVNKHGRQSAEYAQMYNDAFASDVPIITFPFGLVSRRRKGVIADFEWKPSFVKQAVATRRDVVPVYFDGRLSNFFYRLSSLRRGLGIKANIEMLYLPDEMFRQAGGHFRIVIGDPVGWESLNDGRSARHHAARLREMAYALKKTD